MILWASSFSPLVGASAVTAFAALLAAVFAFVGNRRGSRDSREIALIHESQDALRADNMRLRGDNVDLRVELAHIRESQDALRVDNARLREDNAELLSHQTASRLEIVGLREQVEAMRSELAEALSQHSECERIRATLERVITDLEQQQRSDEA